MKLYGLKTCDACRKALKLIGNTEFIDVRETGVPGEVMARAWAEFGETLLNRRSTTWRGLEEAERAGDALTLLARHPTLMKRPLIETRDGRLFLGWDKAVQAEVLG